MRTLVFIGPSGSGKSTLVHELERRGIVEVTASWTTRPPRTDEGVHADHHFVTEKGFDELTASGFFLEVVEMFGSRYGLPELAPPDEGAVRAIVVRAPLLDLVANHLPDHVTYQIESNLDIVEERLRSRRVPEAEIQDRLRSYAGEVALGRHLCHRRFDTSLSLAHVVAAVEDAIAEDFIQERSTSR